MKNLGAKSSIVWILWAGLSRFAWRGASSMTPEPPAGRCSYTFLVPEQKITGPICASARSPGKDEVTQAEVAEVGKLLHRQRREIDTLRALAEVDGHLVADVKLLRRESRNMNSRVTQLYTQLLHEIIRRRDDALGAARLESRSLNASAEALRLAARYRELELNFGQLANLVNEQAVIIAALEERCLEIYGRRETLAGPPLVQVVPERIPVNTRLNNEIVSERDERDGPSRVDSPPTVGSWGNVTSEGPFRDCYHALHVGHTVGGIYLLKANGSRQTMQAWCEHSLDNGGWTVIQRRRDGSVNFFRNWESYKKGFGHLDGEYWLGLENIYRLTQQADYRLMVELEDWTGKRVYAEYSSFRLEPDNDFYRLRLGAYQGNAGDSLTSHNGKPFTTLDRDRDSFTGNCAHFNKGGWWYNSCGQANLNGVWYPGGVYRAKFQDGIFWADYGGGFYSLKGVQMMIRPID